MNQIVCAVAKAIQLKMILKSRCLVEQWIFFKVSEPWNGLNGNQSFFLNQLWETWFVQQAKLMLIEHCFQVVTMNTKDLNRLIKNELGLPLDKQECLKKRRRTLKNRSNQFLLWMLEFSVLRISWLTKSWNDILILYQDAIKL